LATPNFQPYRAFISYSHHDADWCDWLHKSLERYRFSAELAGRLTAVGPVPRHLRPVFRDRADFSSGPLREQTIDALKNSQFLIVIASPRSAASAYVNEEIRLFKSFGGEGKVLSLIVDGDAPHCFAPALRFRVGPAGDITQEPADVVGADVAKDGKREALVKIVAQLAGLPYRECWIDQAKVERADLARRAAAAAVAVIAVLAIFTSFAQRRDVVQTVTTHEEAAAARDEKTSRGIDELKQRLDALGQGGEAAKKALAEIRGLLRANAPDIDAVSDEQLPKLVQRILDDLQKPGARAADFSGAVRRALEQAQREIGELKFVDAAKTLDDALAKSDAEDRSRGKEKAALLAERGRVASLQLRYREAAGFYAKAAEATAFDQKLAWRYTEHKAEALYAQGDQFGDNAALTEAIATHRAALALAPRETAPQQWAMTLNNLGNALETLGERESGTARLEEAASAYRAALQEYRRERVPPDWAMTQNNLGNVLKALGERESGTLRLEGAVEAFRAALQEFTRERTPLQWATTQHNLGAALSTLGERESGTERLEEAVSAYRAALQEWTRKRVPLDSARTLNGLGNALSVLGERESGTARLEEAVSTFRAALQEYRRERVPLEWAMTQTNLGSALSVLGERESGTARLEEAVSAFHAALQEYMRERVPLDWAMSTGNQGVAIALIAERKKDAALARKAIEQLGAALGTSRAGGHAPNAAYYEEQLAKAQALLARLKKR
jgi:tetratricopeptide (TPR) repeat protein